MHFFNVHIMNINYAKFQKKFYSRTRYSPSRATREKARKEIPALIFLRYFPRALLAFRVCLAFRYRSPKIAKNTPVLQASTYLKGVYPLDHYQHRGLIILHVLMIEDWSLLRLWKVPEGLKVFAFWLDRERLWKLFVSARSSCKMNTGQRLYQWTIALKPVFCVRSSSHYKHVR